MASPFAHGGPEMMRALRRAQRVELFRWSVYLGLPALSAYCYSTPEIKDYLIQKAKVLEFRPERGFMPGFMFEEKYIQGIKKEEQKEQEQGQELSSAR